MSERVAVAGHKGMLGRALVRRLPAWCPDGDLRNPADAEAAFAACDVVLMAAGVGGGIAKNLRVPADLARDTLRLLTGTLEGARRAGVSRFVWFGCACLYPRNGGAPLTLADLWRGPLEPTSQAFAAAQLAGVELTRASHAQYGLQALCLVCPTLYGPGDDFSADGHVVAALIRRFHEARKEGADSVRLWGTGRARRQVLYVDDLADAAVKIAAAPWFPTAIPLLNVAGEGAMGVAGLAAAIASVVGYEGEIRWTGEGPEGAPAKELASGVPALFIPTPLEAGLRRTYEWFLANAAHLPGGQIEKTMAMTEGG